VPGRADHAIHWLLARRLIWTVVALGAISGCASAAPPVALVRAWTRPLDAGDATLAWRFKPDPEAASGLPLGRGWEIQTVFAGAGATSALCRGADGEPVATLASPTLADFDARVRLQPRVGGGETLGLAFRVQGDDRYYLARLNSRTNGLRLYRRDGADWYLLDSRNLPVPVGRWQELDVRAEGAHLFVGLGGEPLLQADDDAYVGGQIAFWIEPGSGGCLEELSVVSLAGRR
jgi:hypothetical protein